MFSKGIFRLFLNCNLYSSRIKLPKYSNGFFTRNVHASGDVLPSENENCLDNLPIIKTAFTDYLLKNNNFKNPVWDICRLNFPVENEHESLQLLFKFNKDLGNVGLFNEVLDCLAKEVKTFELEDFLKAIAAGRGVMRSLDHDCQNKFVLCLEEEIKRRNFTFDELLEIIFVVKHSLGKKKIIAHFFFSFKLYKKYANFSKLQTFQAVHLFYYFDKFSPEMRKSYSFLILKYLLNNMPNFNADELAIVLGGLKKAELYSRNLTFLQIIADKTLKEIDNISSQHLFPICQFLKGSSSPAHRKVISDFQEELMQHLSKFNTKSLISALYANEPFSLNLNLWDKVSKMLLPELKTLKINDIERISGLVVSLNLQIEEFFKHAIQELEQRPNFILNAPNNVSFCKNMILSGAYSEKLLEIIMSKDFIEGLLCRSFFNECYNWNFINYSLQVEKPEMSVDVSEIKNNKPLTKIPPYKKVEKFSLFAYKLKNKLSNILCTMYGEDKVCLEFPLPHFDSGIVMRFDRNLNALPIPDEYMKLGKTDIKKPTDDMIWLCMNVIIHPVNNIGGFLKAYMRQLCTLGYKPFLIYHYEFLQMYRLKNEETTAYVENIVQSALQQALQEGQKT